MSAQDPRLNRFLAAAKPSATYGVMARVELRLKDRILTMNGVSKA